MRIGWFTPCAEGNAAAGFSAGVAAALVDLGHDPVLMRIDDGDRPACAFVREAVAWRFWPYLHDVEMLFYNVGDDFAAFAPVADLMRRRPGIAILHDATLAGYFAAHAAACGVAAPTLGAAASIERIATLATGTVFLAPGDEAAAHAGPVLDLSGTASPRAMAERLVAFAAEVAAFAPLAALVGQLAEPITDLGVGRDDPLVGRVAAAAESLFAPPSA